MKDLLKHPTDTQAIQAAQAYTENFSADVANLEGLYISEWNTHVLAHTNPAVVGITTRKDDPLKALQDALVAAEGVYNTGIIISPASKQQIVSLYQGIFDENGQPLGLVGGGIFTQGLVDILDSLELNGMQMPQKMMPVIRITRMEKQSTYQLTIIWQIMDGYFSWTIQKRKYHKGDRKLITVP
ncbi:MAG: PDC sensor domain-containing protein [Lachnospiraceae bacterium]|nr:PDC sensor domain-containing protein [Lachnospiraceae bacterium]